jgi:predicted  nucleic acid-binding Zn-ribbon protein
MSDKIAEMNMDELCGNAAPVKAKMQPKLDRYQAIMLLFAEAFGPLVHAVADVDDAAKKMAKEIDNQRKRIVTLEQELADLKKQLKDREILA